MCVEGEYWCSQPIITGADPGKGPGYYAGILSREGEGPRKGDWFVAVIDANDNLVSERVHFDTDTVSCEPNGTGHQHVIVDFKKIY